MEDLPPAWDTNANSTQKEWEALFESSDVEEFDGFYDHLNVCRKKWKNKFNQFFVEKLGCDLYVNHYGTSRRLH